MRQGRRVVGSGLPGRPASLPLARCGRSRSLALRAEQGRRRHGPHEAVVGVALAPASGSAGAPGSLETLRAAGAVAAAEPARPGGQCQGATALPGHSRHRAGAEGGGRSSAGTADLCVYREWRATRVRCHRGVSVEGGLERGASESRTDLEPWACGAEQLSCWAGGGTAWPQMSCHPGMHRSRAEQASAS